MTYQANDSPEAGAALAFDLARRAGSDQQVKLVVDPRFRTKKFIKLDADLCLNISTLVVRATEFSTSANAPCLVLYYWTVTYSMIALYRVNNDKLWRYTF